MSSDRRKFIKQLSGSALLLGPSLSGLASVQKPQEIVLKEEKKIAPGGKLRIATIGMGIMGFNDTKTAIKVPGIELVACCDLYDGRLVRAKEVFGKNIDTTKDYRELLNRKDIDAVIIATSDNWHVPISIAAMRKGKAVYCEKPVIQKISEGAELVKVQKETKAVFQVGSQRVSSIAFAKAKELYKAGEIGQINSVEASFVRQSALGAWQYTIPLDASPQTVDWQTFQATTSKKHPYSDNRFFRWRNYRDYGTGVAGDLFVHLLSSIHFITDSKGPSKIFSIGDLCYWKDGRDVPDVMNAVLQYPESPEHPAFEVSLRVNFVSGEGEKGSTKISGSDGVMDFKGNGFTIYRNKMAKAPGYGGWDSFDTYPEAMQKKIAEAYNKKYGDTSSKITQLPDINYITPQGYDESYDHFFNFFESIRTGKPVVEDAEFGLRAAAPCLACNDSYFENKVINWDPVNMKLI